MIVKLVYFKNGKTFKDKEGNEVESKSFGLELENGTRIIVKPVYKDDSKLLKAFAEKI